MKRWIAGVLCIGLLLGMAGCKSGGAVSGGGQEGSPRVASASAALCQISARLELDLVGIPKTDFPLPEIYEGVQEVGPPMTPDLETLKMLNPTDVLIPNSLQYDLKPLFENAKIPATFINLNSLEGLFAEVKMLGEKYDRQAQAEELISEYEGFMADYSKKTEGKEKPTVLILMGIPGSYMVATEASYVGSLVKLAGGENVFQSTEAFLNINTEELKLRDPDVILRTSHAMPEMVMAMFDKDFNENDIWKHFRAVKEKRVYDLSNESFGMSANLNYQPALNELQELLYGIRSI